MDGMTSKTFEAALRDLGMSRLRLDQVVMAYQRAFPADSMRADMRERLHEAIIELCRSGVINIPGEEVNEGVNVSLPTVIEISASANFIQPSSDRIN